MLIGRSAEVNEFSCLSFKITSFCSISKRTELMDRIKRGKKNEKNIDS